MDQAPRRISQFQPIHIYAFDGKSPLPCAKDNMSASLAQLTGLPEPSARVLLAVLSAFPLAFAYQLFVSKTSRSAQHVYFLLSGLWMTSYCIGWSTLHLLSDVLLIYLILLVLGPSSLSILLAWAICMGHLLYGYSVAFRRDIVHSYVNWTMPHCVLTLKLIGLVMDLNDGQKSIEAQSKDQREHSFKEPPSLLEILGFSFHFGTVLVGPILNFKRYQDFVNGTLYNRQQHGYDCIFPGMLRTLFAAFYVVLFTVLGGKFPTEYVASAEYAAHSFLYKLGYLMLWGKINLCRYIAVWLMTESACIFTGITYNGQDEYNRPLWDGLANVRPFALETSYRLQDVIENFNRTVNNWVFRHVYKRLQPLQSRLISQSVSMVFLILWHGLHVGYLINFSLEVPAILAEQKLGVFFQSIAGRPVSQLPFQVKAPLTVLLALTRCVFLHYPFACFMLLRWNSCYQFMSSVYFIGHVVIIIWLLLYYGGLGRVARRLGRDDTKQKTQ